MCSFCSFFSMIVFLNEPGRIVFVMSDSLMCPTAMFFLCVCKGVSLINGWLDKLFAIFISGSVTCRWHGPEPSQTAIMLFCNSWQTPQTYKNKLWHAMANICFLSPLCFSSEACFSGHKFEFAGSGLAAQVYLKTCREQLISLRSMSGQAWLLPAPQQLCF